MAPAPARKKGDFLADYEGRIFGDVKAEPGEKASSRPMLSRSMGSIDLIDLLQAVRL